MTVPAAVVLCVCTSIAGAVIGSFAGVVRHRGWRDALEGRSRCESCARQLRWYELLPLASFAALRGRCRTCRSPIGWATLGAEAGGTAVGLVVGVVAVGILTVH
jgi:leader peptidase (prepilin peptidase)/N-methyltransferase